MQVVIGRLVGFWLNEFNVGLKPCSEQLMTVSESFLRMVWSVGWLAGFNVGLELRSGLMSTVWDSFLRMFRKYAIIILIR